MFARRLRLSLLRAEQVSAVPAAWLDQFFMRDFTGYHDFDETLVVGEGLLEAGSSVSPAAVEQRFEQWLHGRKMISPDTRLRVEIVKEGGAWMAGVGNG